MNVSGRFAFRSYYLILASDFCSYYLVQCVLVLLMLDFKMYICVRSCSQNVSLQGYSMVLKISEVVVGV